MNLKIKDLIPFAVHIERTDKSQKVIDWFNEEFKIKYRSILNYISVGHVGSNACFHLHEPDCRILTESEFLALLTDLPEKGEMIKVWDYFAIDASKKEFYKYDSELEYPYLVKTKVGSILSFKHFARIPAKITITEAEIKRVFAEKHNVNPDLIEIAK